MKVATSVTIDPEVLAKAKKNIPNISGEFQKYLGTILDLKKAKKEADYSRLSEIKIIELSKELVHSVDLIKKLKKENKNLKESIEKIKAKSEGQISGYTDIGHGGL